MVAGEGDVCRGVPVPREEFEGEGEGEQTVDGGNDVEAVGDGEGAVLGRLLVWRRDEYGTDVRAGRSHSVHLRRGVLGRRTLNQPC